MIQRGTICILGVLFTWTATAHEPRQDDSQLLKAAEAFQSGQFQSTVESAGKFIASNPTHVEALLLRAAAYDRLRKHQQAIADFNRAIKQLPSSADLYYQRGRQRFKAGDVHGSISDFNQQIKLNPQSERSYWERGISCYYIGKFREGAKQFELYQTYHAGDVENVVWRFLCQARFEGARKARQDMLKLAETDQRVPMMEIYSLFLGQAKPEDVFVAARAGNPEKSQLNQRLFYAHLYVGLFHAAHGNKPEMKKHILQADRTRIPHYMWDVAHVHANLLRR